MRDTLMTMFDVEPWLFGQPLCLEGKLTDTCDAVGETALSTMWDTGEAS